MTDPFSDFFASLRLCVKITNTNLTPRRKDAKFSTNGFRADLIVTDWHLGLLIHLGAERIIKRLIHFRISLRLCVFA